MKSFITFLIILFTATLVYAQLIRYEAEVWNKGEEIEYKWYGVYNSFVENKELREFYLQGTLDDLDVLENEVEKNYKDRIGDIDLLRAATKGL